MVEDSGSHGTIALAILFHHQHFVLSPATQLIHTVNDNGFYYARVLVSVPRHDIFSRQNDLF